MRVLGIVPARAGSARVPRKNIRIIGGRPLVAWVLEAAIEAQLVDHVVVSSDSDAVLEIAERISPGSALERPKALCGASSPAIDYVTHALESVEERAGAPSYDAVAILQPSSPFTRPIDIDATVSLLHTSGADSAVTITRVPHDLHPVKFKYLDGNVLVPLIEDERGRASPGDLSEVFVRNGSVYCARRSTITRGTILGDVSVGYIMPRELSVDINDEFDFEFAEFLASRMQEPIGPH